jgi:nucleoside-diphosphate-sugar epimerase
MTDNGPILVTGAAGQLGGIGRTVTSLLLQRRLPVRAMVRREDDRAAALRTAGAEVVVGDLLWKITGWVGGHLSHEGAAVVFLGSPAPSSRPTSIAMDAELASIAASGVHPCRRWAHGRTSRFRAM